MAVAESDALARIEQGYQLLSEGHSERALDRFLPVAEQMPGLAAAWHGLGNACSTLGRDAESLDFLSRACSLSPQTGLYWGDYGKQLLQSGRFGEAAESFSRYLRQHPEDLGAHLMYGQALLALGLTQEAMDEAGFVLARQPKSVPALSLLGDVMRKVGQLDEAISLYQAALREDATHHEIWHNLASVFALAQRWKEAASCAAEAIHLSPGLWQAHLCLGLALYRQKLYEDAEVCLREAHRLSGGHADTCLELGNLALARRDGNTAMQWYLDAIQHSPHNVAAILNAAHLFRLNGGIGEALKLARLAMRVAPTNTVGMNLEATCLTEMGRMREAMAVYQKMLEHDPKDSHARSNLLYNLNFHTAFDPEAVSRIHRAWGGIAEAEAREWGVRRTVRTTAEKRIRVGYVSGDFRRHSVMYFLSCLLEGHDREAFEIYCYSAVDREDEVTAAVRSLDLVWRDVSAMPDAEVAKLISQDEIDILVDLSGHTGGGKIAVFAAKPAPIQCSYLGYPNTTGLSTVDYRLVDSLTDPPGLTDGLYSEKLVRLDPTFLCFEAPTVDVAVNPEPPCVSGGLRFGTFNNSKKIDARTAEAWGALLRTMPAARLILKGRHYRSAESREHVLALLQAEGIAAERVEFRQNELEFANHLAQYNDLDVALDCFPYNGTTTTMEALWMGVPVVTLFGSLHASRVGLSIVTALGKPEWAASNVEEFVAAAKRLAEDPRELASLRRSLREQLRASPLMDARSMVGRVEAFYRDAWRSYCLSQTGKA
jgi:protein O-GlcNAc transferase